MANPCKITFKKTKDGKAKEYTYAEFMTALQDGLFQELVDGGLLNANKIPGENPFAAAAPKEQKGPSVKERKTITTIKNNPDISDKVKNAFSSDRINYNQLPNDVSVAEANAIIESLGMEEADKLAKTGNKDMPSAFRITLAQILIKKYNQAGEYGKAVDVAQDIAELATDYGQAIQALSLFARLTPEGALLAATRMVKKNKDRAVSKHKSKATEVKNTINKINKETAKQVAQVAQAEMERTTASVKMVDRPKTYGKKNKLVTLERYEKARAALKGKMFSAVVPPPELIEIAMFHIEAGARNFADFVKRMKEDFGERANDYLQPAYDEAVSRLDASEKQKAITSSVNKFGRLISEQLPRQADRRSKVEKLQELADQIDAETGNDAFNQILNDYKAILAQEQADNDAVKAQKKLDKLVAFMGTEAGIRKGLKEMNVRIGDLIKQHYSEVDATKEDLINKLVNEAGLTGVEADNLANKIQSEFETLVADKKRKAIERLMPKGPRTTARKEAFEKLVEASNIGAVDEAMVNDAIAEALGVPSSLTPEQAAKITELANAVQEAKTEREELRAIQNLLSYQQNINGISWFEVTQAVWMANMLSGWKTQTINMIANLYNTGALFANAALQRSTSRRLLVKGLAVGWKRGFFEGLDSLKTGYSPIRDKSEIPNILERVTFKGGKFNPVNYAKYVRRLMTAVDVLSFEGLRQMRSFQMAYKKAAAENEGFSSKELRDKALEILNRKDETLNAAIDQAKDERAVKEALLKDDFEDGKITKEEFMKQMDFAKTDERFRIHELIEEKRDSDIMIEAKDYAARGTFNHPPNGLLGLLSQYMNSAKREWPALNFVVPFVNVISNVANETLNYTPVGFARARKEGGTLTGLKPIQDWDAQKRTDLMIKATMGTGLMALTYLLTKLDDDDEEPVLEITTNGFNDFAKNKELMETGWQPYSVRVKNPVTGEYSPWFSYKTSPFMLGLSFIGSLGDAEKYLGEDISADGYKKMSVAATGLTRSFLDQTFLSSGEDFLSSVLDSRDKDLVDNVRDAVIKTGTTIVVPAIYTQTAQKISDIMEIPQKEIRDTYFGRVFRDIPVARDRYNNVINALGDEVPYDSDLLISSDKGKPEDRLWNLVISKKQTIGTPKAPETYLDKDNNEVQLTEEQTYSFMKIRGSYIKKALEENYDALSKLSNADFSKYLTGLKSQATSIAKSSFTTEQKALDKKIAV